MNPQFDQNELRDTLKGHGIEYVFLGASLGARPKDRSCYVSGRALYSLISKTPQFVKSLERVRNGSEKYNLALMCAERDPITCHRTIMVCRHLTDMPINHIISDGTLETHDASIRRLIRLLGVKGEVSEDNKSIIEAAYDIQASRICYTEAEHNRPASVIEKLL
jgi:uncharacterized protein (DUF488 family)